MKENFLKGFMQCYNAVAGAAVMEILGGLFFVVLLVFGAGLALVFIVKLAQWFKNDF